MHVSMGPSYLLVKSSKGDIYATFAGKNRNHDHISNNSIGTKKKFIWVPKALVTDIQESK
jgi:hypothetical protein